MRRRSLLALAALTAAGCRDEPGRGRGGGKAPRELVIFAAASLTDAFGAVAADFEKAHGRIDVKLNFAGSQSLRTQIENGAQPQVFASADESHMQALREAGLVEEPTVFARNGLAIVVPPANPAGIESLADLPKAERLVLAGKSVPAGAYAERMLKNAAADYGEGFAARVHDSVVSRETHVRQTLQKVVLGEADAAIVYATDAKAAGADVKTIAIASEHDVVASYPIATVVGAPHGRLGDKFIAHVMSEVGQARLREHGMQPAEGVAGLR